MVDQQPQRQKKHEGKGAKLKEVVRVIFEQPQQFVKVDIKNQFTAC